MESLRNPLDRRAFVSQSMKAGAVAAVAPLISGALSSTQVAAAPDGAKRIRIGVIGCGSVSGAYLPHLSKSPHIELVSSCDIIPERAVRRAAEFKIPQHYPHIDHMLAGEAFDLLVNLTDMQEHE